MTTRYVDNLLGVYTTSEQYDGTSPTVGTGGVGPFKRIRSACAVSGVDTIWVKANSVYTLTDADQGSEPIDDFAGTSVLPFTIEGYTTTLGDGGQVTIQVGDLATQTVEGDPPEHTACVFLYPTDKGVLVFRNIAIVDPDENRLHTGFHNDADVTHQIQFDNCKFQGLQNGIVLWSDNPSGNTDSWFAGLNRCEFSDCRIGFTTGVAAFGAYVYAVNNLFNNCGQLPGYLSMSATGLGCASKTAVVINNTFLNCVYNALLYDYFTLGIVATNTFKGCDRAIEHWQVIDAYSGHIYNNIFDSNDYVIYGIHSHTLDLTTGNLKFYNNILHNNSAFYNATATYDTTSNPETDPILDTDGSLTGNTPVRLSGISTPMFTGGTVVGSFVAIPSPDAPTITVADAETGTGATVTISGSVSTGTVTVEYVLVDDDSTNYSSTTRTGDGTVSITGLLNGGTYRFWCYQTVDGVSSSPSTCVFETITAGSSDDLYEDVNNPLLFALKTTGEQVIYKKSSGVTRTIWALVDRDWDTDFEGDTKGPQISITVANSDIVGITDTEIDTGGDKISVPTRPGATATYRDIWRIQEPSSVCEPEGNNAITLILR